jgi:5'-deoxynucleotidase YfbR-like HD superfamily hydrolase
MQADDILKLDDSEIIEIVKKLRVGYQLKRTLRYATARDFSVHSESVAEHVFGLIYLSRYFLPLEFPECEIDVGKLDSLILFHDFGEIVHGDIVYNVKTKADEAQEKEDVEQVIKSLPDELGKTYRNSHDEYEHGESAEAKFAYALDKVEPLFELYDPVNEKSLIKHKFTSEVSMSVKLPATEDFPVMRKFVEVINRDMIKRDVFWEED